MTNVLVDLGNYNIKYLAERRGFFSAKYSTKFNPNPEMFQRINFNGETTYIEIGEYEREFNKVNKNYLPLLFYAISNATEESDINLCLLLPIAQMPNKDKFINKLKNNIKGANKVLFIQRDGKTIVASAPWSDGMGYARKGKYLVLSAIFSKWYYHK